MLLSCDQGLHFGAGVGQDRYSVRQVEGYIEARIRFSRVPVGRWRRREVGPGKSWRRAGEKSECVIICGPQSSRQRDEEGGRPPSMGSSEAPVAICTVVANGREKGRRLFS